MQDEVFVNIEKGDFAKLLKHDQVHTVVSILFSVSYTSTPHLYAQLINEKAAGNVFTGIGLSSAYLFGKTFIIGVWIFCLHFSSVIN